MNMMNETKVFKNSSFYDFNNNVINYSSDYD